MERGERAEFVAESIFVDEGIKKRRGVFDGYNSHIKIYYASRGWLVLLEE